MKPQPRAGRRGFITAAATAPAALAAAAALPLRAPVTSAAATVAASGYRLTEHVARYYQTLKR